MTSLSAADYDPVTPFRDPAAVKALVRRIESKVTRPWSIMEICGGQTHAIRRYGLDELLPDGVELIHGPGCPVCVTPASKIDRAVELSLRSDVLLCSYGDMIRVPGSGDSLAMAKARGGNLRQVYCALDALQLAREQPDKEIVFFAIGFETTAPGHAQAVQVASDEGITNFSLLCSQVTVPAALTMLLDDEHHRIDAVLAAGHVCAITGSGDYGPVAERFRVPIVVTGFEPVDLLLGIADCIDQLEAGSHQVTNSYARIANDDGNPVARAVLAKIFEPVDMQWRGIGVIPASGLGLREAFAGFDAERKFQFAAQVNYDDVDQSGCISGQILRGLAAPDSCPNFGQACTPVTPLGAPMVSAEGACAAYYHYARFE